MTINYVNYFLTSKNSRLINGHIKSENLYDKILSHDGSEAYCCYFDLDEKYLKLEWDTGKYDTEGKKIYEYLLSGQSPSNTDYVCNGKSFAQYEGICRPTFDMVGFDFDSKEDPQKSLDDVRKFLEWLDIDDAITFFSGSKGFHIMVPFGYFPFEPNEHLPNQLKDLAKYLLDYFPTLDTSIYNYNRKFRVPFTKHDKTGLYKAIVPNEEVGNYNIDTLTHDLNQLTREELITNFLPEEKERKPLEVICEAVEESKRVSYEIDKAKGGTKDQGTNFEKFEGKLCIKKMLESRCDDIGRNNACLRIVNDYYRTQKSRSKCERDVTLWATENGLPLQECLEIITNIYDRNANYNFGCQDECKSSYCSAKCDIWSKLDPDKRPVTIDQPLSTAAKLKTEFQGVQWLMKALFGCKYDEITNSFSQGLIVKQNAEHLFYYKDKHWQHVDESKIHIIKTRLNAEYDNKLNTRKLDAVFKMFVLYAPEVPEDVDLFAPKNDMANFKDGTLHLKSKGNGVFLLEFKEHNKLDFCTTIIDLNYKDYLKNKDVVNEDFEKWLLEYLNNDEESFKLIQEMYGSSLMPKFPQFFVLIGKSGTGKSTTIKVLKQLHKNERNISGVSPDKFHGFHMDSMIGKLINIVNDIKTNARIDDDIVKQVDDQEPVRIERKRKSDVYTKLPALHIFGANKMPATAEGYSGAMKRRFSIVNFDKKFTGKKNTEIAKDLFEGNPLGVLAFSLRGLERLVLENNGEYTSSTKSKENVDKWTKKTDIVWSFLNSVMEEPLEYDGKMNSLIVDENAKILRAKICKMFRNWQHDFIEQKSHIGKQDFLYRLEDAGFIKKVKDGYFYIEGIGEAIDDDTVI